jgi:hypothetical protein
MMGLDEQVEQVIQVFWGVFSLVEGGRCSTCSRRSSFLFLRPVGSVCFEWTGDVMGDA